MLDTQLFLRLLCVSQKTEFIFKSGDVGVKRSRCYAVSLAFRVQVCRQYTPIPWVDLNCIWDGIQITFQNMLPTFQAPTSIPFRLMASSDRHTNYPLSYGVPVRERYGSTLLPATREQHDQKLYTKSLTRDLKLMYSRFTLVRISINL